MTILLILIVIVIVYDYINGMNDSSNIVATIVSSRAMSIRSALILASVAEFIGPFIIGTAVAKTVGNGIIEPSCLNIKIIFAAIGGAIFWNLFTLMLGFPSSSSHSLIGGLVGAVVISSGFGSIHFNGILKVLIVLFMSPVIGFGVGYVITKLIYKVVANATPRINNVFKWMQIGSSAFLALNHGGNDAQKSMGILTMGLVVLKYQSNFTVPGWVVMICALALALGIATGSLKIMKTIGSRVFRVRPIHGFSVQLSSSIVIFGASLIGGPVSTTHVVNSSVVGVGSSERFSKVRWSVVTDILISWVATLPASALVAALLYKLIGILT